MSTQQTLFSERFLESFTGKSIMNDSKVAIIELIANAWDAGATRVKISWPNDDGDFFSIRDNGHGMTDQQFSSRFRTLAYDRVKDLGEYALIPYTHKDLVNKRPVFGRNGKGRLSGFAFGEIFNVMSWTDSEAIHYQVTKGSKFPLKFKKFEVSDNIEEHGTEIFVKNAIKPNIDFENIKSEIGMRFLTDPNFEVVINGEKITFLDIPEDNISEITVPVDDIGNFQIKVIDVQVADKNTHQHGIAWHVKNRLVGECTWKGSGNEHLVDGRRNAAKRYIFIINADKLEQAVSPDWTYFISSDSKYKKAFPIIQDAIKDHLLELSQETRETTFKEIEQSNLPILKNLGIVSREKWETFVTSVQEECPSISQTDLEKLANLLANLEQSDSKFNLINLLSNAAIDELDNLTEVLQKWDINIAKIVLDEIEYRSKLLEKLQTRVLNNFTDEVQELQPLFHRGLWIFGPEYETIEYTSNVGMTRVIQELFGGGEKGSSIRPDFAILRDSSVGLYSFPKYDEEGSESGIDRLTIVELKRPGVPLGSQEVDQAWKYVRELLDKGYISKYSKVTCFVLGSELVPYDAEKTTRMDNMVVIQPLLYDTIMKRAKSRLLNLYDKLKHTPFMQDTKIREYMRAKEQIEIF